MIYFLYVALFSGFFPLLLLVYKRFPKTPALPLILLVILGTVYEIVFSLILKWNSAVYFSLYEVLSMIAVLYYFYYILKIRRIYLVVVMGVILFFQCLWKSDFLATLFNLDTLNLIFTTFIVITGSVWYFVKSVGANTTLQKADIPNFYFISGLLVYHTSTFLFFMTDQLIPNISPELKHEFWAVNIGATLVYRLILSTGIWKISTL